MKGMVKLHRFFVPVLFPLTVLYWLGFILYQMLHRLGMIQVHHFSAPVISVGNITMGGSGKTPFVILLAQLLEERKKTVAIVSKGYGRNSKSNEVIDVDKVKIEDTGEEPWLISMKTRMPVIVSNRKFLACHYAIETYKPDVLILDDGFQSFSICRNLDIVLIDATGGFLESLLIPAGVLREPLKAIQRADAIVVTRCRQAGKRRVRSVTGRIQNTAGHIPLFLSTHETIGLVKFPGGEASNPAILDKKRIMGLSAIAHNPSFLQSLSQIGLNIVTSRCFVDHHRYTSGDIDGINQLIASHSIDAIITTEKDLYALRPFANALSVPVYALSIRLALHNRGSFMEFLEQKGIL